MTPQSMEAWFDAGRLRNKALELWRMGLYGPAESVARAADLAEERLIRSIRKANPDWGIWPAASSGRPDGSDRAF